METQVLKITTDMLEFIQIDIGDILMVFMTIGLQEWIVLRVGVDSKQMGIRVVEADLLFRRNGTRRLRRL